MHFNRAATLLFVVFFTVSKAETFQDAIFMPGVRTYRDDSYLCRMKRVEDNETFITSFQPEHDESVAHHMILFACEEPGVHTDVWQCDDREGGEPVCTGAQTILFSWAMNAPGFTLPPGISFPVGLHPYKYLVLQVHYKDAKTFSDNPDKYDTSGFILTVQTEPTPRLAGIYLLAAVGEIGPNGWTVVRTACRYTGYATLHPFAFRVHAHGHGVINKGYAYHDGERSLIGAQSPQRLQTYYPVEDKDVKIYPHDLISAMCNMTNHEDKVFKMGNTRGDEMCNFYMMYWVSHDDADQLTDPLNQDCAVDGDTAIREIAEEKAIDFANQMRKESYKSFSDSRKE
ncbi:unnamed protein product [Calicophoron daubneyi]|uniref:peptidylglycine monooxygenase n=1 Tax=Calicophoron daubneyi TaxID=300641 RepID=A0AAV2T6C7_CALDB